jgi:Flp pilus assembly protein CpaB
MIGRSENEENMMPEEAPAVQNWRLLIVACVLGLVVMVVYNLHISKVRKGLEKEKVTVFRYERDIEVGETIAGEDLASEKISKDIADSIGRLLDKDEKDTMAVDRKIWRNVSKGEFVLMGHFTRSKDSGSAESLKKNEVQITIPVDPKRIPGTVLRIGNYVNILGMLPMKSGTWQTKRIIEGLKVVAIGGQTDRSGTSRSGSGGAQSGVRSYNSITVVMLKDPDVSLQWGNLQTYLRGPAIIEICSSESLPKVGSRGRIALDLSEFTKQAATASYGAGYEDGS